MNRKFKLIIGLSILVVLLCTDRITAGRGADDDDDEGADTDAPGTVKDRVGKSRDGSRTDDEVVKREEEAIRLDGLNAAQFKELREKAEKHAFQAEVNRMMKIIINSLYKNKEIFLRELISNASDALDKIRLLSLTDKNALSATPELVIRIKADKDAGMLHVIDTGIGMSKSELEKNLGTIAKSGTSEFLERLEKVSGDEKPEIGLTDMIGQFGVGFYSSFLVADRVIVTSKSNDDAKQYIWESDSSSFTISEDPRGNTLKRGSQISLVLKEEARDYLEENTLKELVKKYSQFINFPIYMWTSKTEQVEVPADEEEAAPEKKETDEAAVEDEKEEKKDKKKTVDRTVWDWELINDTKPIWVRKPHEVTDDEYNAFYKTISKDHDAPLAKIHFTAEGEVTFRAILYLPKAAPPDLFSQYGKKTDFIKLYVRRVFITDDFSDMMPKYLSFVKGVVDSDDLPLNVSRETLQQHKLLKVIKKKLVRKTLDMLKKLNDEEFETFWKEYSTSVKLGVIEDHANRTRLAKLLRFNSSNSDNQTTLADYVSRMKEKQEAIYFVGCSNLDECKKSPFAEKLLKKGFEVLYLGEPIDEYTIQSLPEFDGKRFQNVAKEGLKVDESESAKEAKAALEKEYEPLMKWLKEDALKDLVEKATISDRLAESPAALVASSYGWSGNMERIMKAQAYAKAKDPSQDFYSTQKKTLELNPRHPLVKELRRRFEDVDAQDSAKDLAESLLDMATVRSGYFVKDTAVFSERFERMLRRAANIPLDEPVEQEPESDESSSNKSEDSKDSSSSKDEDHDEL